jgi:sugar lactone lactonase YvrE
MNDRSRFLTATRRPMLGRSRHGARRLLWVAVAWVGLACSSTTAPSGGGGGGGGNATGTLAIAVTVPNGVAPTITITGPSGYSKTLSSTQTLTSLATGSYTISAGTGLTADSIVSIAYAGSVTGSPATVTANGTTTATVTYAEPWSSSGVLWVASALGNSISGYTSTQLRTTGAPVPGVVVGTDSSVGPIQGATALVVDQTGGIWFANDGDTIYHYTSAQIAQSTKASPALKLVSSAMSKAAALAFDNNGNLWVADQGVGKIFEFPASQLAAGGSVTPAVVLSSAFGSISRPFSMTFDTRGDLWVSNYGDSTVAGFSPSQLHATGSPVPYAGLVGATATTNNLGIQFDAQGDLWVANLTDTHAEYTPGQLTSIGTPTPKVIIVLHSTGPSGLQEPGPMAFDNSGALWMADVQKSRLLRFMPSQLTTSGSPTAAVTISSTGSGSHAAMALPYWITFSPHAVGLPSN